jgi:hypothetical protein
MFLQNRIRPTAAVLFFVFFAASLFILNACKKDDGVEEPEPQKGIKQFAGNYGWTCASGQNCQDVFELELEQGSVVSFQAGPVSAGSVAQISLYAPGTVLGGVNLFTGTTKELLCNAAGKCDENQAGQLKNNFAVPATGVYQFAVSRNWSLSCEAKGTYKLKIASDRNFTFNKQTVEDAVAKVKESECK